MKEQPKKPTLVMDIHMGQKCRNCGHMGTMGDSGLCISCVGKKVVKKAEAK